MESLSPPTQAARADTEDGFPPSFVQEQVLVQKLMQQLQERQSHLQQQMHQLHELHAQLAERSRLSRGDSGGNLAFSTATGAQQREARNSAAVSTTPFGGTETACAGPSTGRDSSLVKELSNDLVRSILYVEESHQADAQDEARRPRWVSPMPIDQSAASTSDELTHSLPSTIEIVPVAQQPCTQGHDATSCCTSQPSASAGGPRRHAQAASCTAGNSDGPGPLSAAPSVSAFESGQPSAACVPSVDPRSSLPVSKEGRETGQGESSPSPFLLHAEQPAVLRVCPSTLASRAAPSTAAAVAAAAERTGSRPAARKSEESICSVSVSMSAGGPAPAASPRVALKPGNAGEGPAFCSPPETVESPDSFPLSSFAPSALQASVRVPPCLSSSALSASFGPSNCPPSGGLSSSPRLPPVFPSSEAAGVSLWNPTSDAGFPSRTGLKASEQPIAHRQQPTRSCKHGAVEEDATRWWQTTKERVACRRAARVGLPAKEVRGSGNGEGQGTPSFTTDMEIKEANPRLYSRGEHLEASPLNKEDTGDPSRIQGTRSAATRSGEARTEHERHSPIAGASSGEAPASASMEAGTGTFTDAASAQTRAGRDRGGSRASASRQTAGESSSGELGRPAAALGNTTGAGCRGDGGGASGGVGVEEVFGERRQAGVPHEGPVASLPLSLKTDLVIDEEALDAARDSVADPFRSSAQDRNEVSERECAALLEKLFHVAPRPEEQAGGSEARGVEANAPQRGRPRREYRMEERKKLSTDETSEENGSRKVELWGKSRRRTQSSAVNKTSPVPSKESPSGSPSPFSTGVPGDEQKLRNLKTEESTLPRHSEEADEDADEFLTFIGSPSSRRIDRGRPPRSTSSHWTARCATTRTLPLWRPSEGPPRLGSSRSGGSSLSSFSPASTGPFSSFGPSHAHGFSRPSRGGRASGGRPQNEHSRRASPGLPSTSASSGPSSLSNGNTSISSLSSPSISSSASCSSCSSPSSSSSPCSVSSSSTLSFGPAFLGPAYGASEATATGGEMPNLSASDSAGASPSQFGRALQLEGSHQERFHPFAPNRSRRRLRSAESLDRRRQQNHFQRGKGRGRARQWIDRRGLEARGSRGGVSQSCRSAPPPVSPSLAFASGQSASAADPPPPSGARHDAHAAVYADPPSDDLSPAAGLSRASGLLTSGSAALCVSPTSVHTNSEGVSEMSCPRGVGSVGLRAEGREGTIGLRDSGASPRGPSASYPFSPASSSPSPPSAGDAATVYPLSRLSPSHASSDLRPPFRLTPCRQAGERNASTSRGTKAQPSADCEGREFRPVQSEGPRGAGGPGDGRRRPQAAAASSECLGKKQYEAGAGKVRATQGTTVGVHLRSSSSYEAIMASPPFLAEAQESEQAPQTETSLTCCALASGIAGQHDTGTEKEDTSDKQERKDKGGSSQTYMARNEKPVVACATLSSVSPLAGGGGAKIEGKGAEQAQCVPERGSGVEKGDGERDGAGEEERSKVVQGTDKGEILATDFSLSSSSTFLHISLQKTKTEKEGDERAPAGKEQLGTGSRRSRESSEDRKTDVERAGQPSEKLARSRRKRRLDEGDGGNNRKKKEDKEKPEAVVSEPREAEKSEGQGANQAISAREPAKESTGRCVAARTRHRQMLAEIDAFMNPAASVSSSFRPADSSSSSRASALGISLLASPTQLPPPATFPSSTLSAASALGRRRALPGARADARDPPGRPAPSGPRREAEPAGTRAASDGVSRSLRCAGCREEETAAVDSVRRVRGVRRDEDDGEAEASGKGENGCRGGENCPAGEARVERVDGLQTGCAGEDCNDEKGRVEKDQNEREISRGANSGRSSGVAKSVAKTKGTVTGLAGTDEEASDSDVGKEAGISEKKLQQTAEEERGDGSKLQGIEAAVRERMETRETRDEPGSRACRNRSEAEERRASKGERKRKEREDETRDGRDVDGSSKVKQSRGKRTAEDTQPGEERTSIPKGRQEKTPAREAGCLEPKGGGYQQEDQGEVDEMRMEKATTADRGRSRGAVRDGNEGRKGQATGGRDDGHKVRRTCPEKRGKRQKIKTAAADVEALPVHVVEDDEEDGVAELRVESTPRDKKREDKARDRTAREKAKQVSLVKEAIAVEESCTLSSDSSPDTLSSSRRALSFHGGEERRKRDAPQDSPCEESCRADGGRAGAASLPACAKAKTQLSRVSPEVSLSSPLVSPGGAPPSRGRPLGWGVLPRPRLPAGIGLKGADEETVSGGPASEGSAKGQPVEREAGPNDGEPKGRLGRAVDSFDRKEPSSRPGEAAGFLCPLHASRDLSFLESRAGVGNAGAAERRLGRATASPSWTGRGERRGSGPDGGEGATGETDRAGNAARGAASRSGRCPCCLKLVNIFWQFCFVRRPVDGVLHPVDPFTLATKSKLPHGPHRVSHPSYASRGAAPSPSRPSFVRRGTLLQVHWRFEAGARGGGRVSKVSLSGQDPMVGTYFLRAAGRVESPGKVAAHVPNVPRPLRESGGVGEAAPSTPQQHESSDCGTEGAARSSPASSFGAPASKATAKKTEKGTEKGTGSGAGLDSRGGQREGATESGAGPEHEAASTSDKTAPKLHSLVAGWSATFSCLEGHVFDRSYEELEGGKWCPVCSAAALLTSAAKRSAMRHDRQVEEKFRERQQKLIQEARQQFAATAAGMSSSAERLRRQAQEDVRRYSSSGQNDREKSPEGPGGRPAPYIPQPNLPVFAAAAATAAAFAARAAGGATGAGGSSAGGVGGKEGHRGAGSRQGGASGKARVVPEPVDAKTEGGPRSLCASKEGHQGDRRDAKAAGKPLTEAQALAVRRVLACKQTSAWTILQIERPSRDTAPQTLRTQARAAFRQLALLVHPDKNPHPRAAEAMHVVTGAFQQIIGHR
uniref:DnaJ domain-containing protein, putative n=1 Tax=Neospora caninum (strain Liverpool) TaxID=572307 RepID=F0JB79_NEOCL|nr:DnaJ domain-containing protein, putative [Neospora caninum Liverpool]CEL71346.1 TPA: DnaJ domain-containing protein, putative [Neospora caninum Liverpool]